MRPLFLTVGEFMKITKHSAADRLDQAVRELRNAVRDLSDYVPASSLLLLRSMARDARTFVDAFPYAIANGETSFCENCRYFTEGPQPALRFESIEKPGNICSVPDPLICPCVNAIGIGGDCDPDFIVPAFLRRQAD